VPNGFTVDAVTLVTLASLFSELISSPTVPFTQLSNFVPVTAVKVAVGTVILLSLSAYIVAPITYLTLLIYPLNP
jgi:hypothetical protein